MVMIDRCRPPEMVAVFGVMKEKEIRRVRFGPVLAAGRCHGQKFSDNMREQVFAQFEKETSGCGPLG
jgi:hypothetical protein